MKVYGFQWQRGGDSLRCIVAAKSQAEVARIMGVNRPSQIFNPSTTVNPREVEVATAEPGVVFCRSMTKWNVPYLKLQKPAPTALKFVPNF